MRWFAVALAFMLAAVQVLIWAWLALESRFTLFPAESPPPYSAYTGPFFILFVLNLVALLAFPLRHRGFGFWFLLLVQTGDLVALLALRVLNVFPDEFVSTSLVVACGTSLVSVGLLLFARRAGTLGRS